MSYADEESSTYLSMSNSACVGISAQPAHLTKREIRTLVVITNKRTSLFSGAGRSDVNPRIRMEGCDGGCRVIVKTESRPGYKRKMTSAGSVCAISTGKHWHAISVENETPARMNLNMLGKSNLQTGSSSLVPSFFPGFLCLRSSCVMQLAVAGAATVTAVTFQPEVQVQVVGQRVHFEH